jgi:hypothetical protein
MEKFMNEREKWRRHKNALCWSFYFMNDNKIIIMPI